MYCLSAGRVNWIATMRRFGGAQDCSISRPGARLPLAGAAERVGDDPIASGADPRELSMKITRWLVVVGALALPASALIWLSPTDGPAPAPTAARPAAVQPAPQSAHVLGSGVVAASKLSDELIRAAEAVKAPIVLPVPSGSSTAAAARVVMPSPVNAVAASQVADNQKIAIFYTGNVIGETDPCG